jgi:wobble nucleotide-excising tRNase
LPFQGIPQKLRLRTVSSDLKGKLVSKCNRKTNKNINYIIQVCAQGATVNVTAANAIITAKKRATGAADVRTVEAALARLRATKTRHEPDARKACDELILAQLEKIAIEENKAAVRKQLDEHTETVIGRYEQTINQLLDDFNAGFRITGTKHGYPGGVASSTYQILINNMPVDLGDAGTPLDRPSFRNTLSAGDRSTLALAFFLAQLHHDPNT